LGIEGMNCGHRMETEITNQRLMRGSAMSVFKRPDSDYYWFKFRFKGKLYQRPTKVKNKRTAETIEAAFRTQLAKGEVSIEDQKPAPTLRVFSDEFKDFVQTRHANKPETVKFYSNRMQRLLEWPSFHDARLDAIDEAMINRYVVMRRKKVGVVAVNRELATLRRAFHLAREWKLIRSVPKVRLLTGEPSRDFVLSQEMESAYLAACPPTLRDVATILLDTGLRLGEAVDLQWPDVHLQPVGGARYGWLKVRDGKTKNAKRNVPLTTRVSQVLGTRQKDAKSLWVFPGDAEGQPILDTSLAHMHQKVCRPVKEGKKTFIFPKAFVLHSMRHTCLTRLGEAGADAFTIMKLAGHSSVTISQRYVHPTGETVELAFERLERLNEKAQEATGGK
jgi:integrase